MISDETKIFSNGLLPQEESIETVAEPDKVPDEVLPDPLKPEEALLEKHLEDTLSLHLQEILAADSQNFADPQDTELQDAAPFDTAPFDAEPLDADPLDADPLDAEPSDTEPSAIEEAEVAAESQDITKILPPVPPADKPRVRDWYFTFMCMNLPIIGWIYLLVLAFRKKKRNRREFARAYLLFKLTFSIITLILLAFVIHIALGYLDLLLEYMEML